MRAVHRIGSLNLEDHSSMVSLALLCVHLCMYKKDREKKQKKTAWPERILEFDWAIPFRPYLFEYVFRTDILSRETRVAVQYLLKPQC